MAKEMEWNGLMGGRLQKLRNQSNLTQEELAECLDVSRQSVSKWELNKTLPDVDKLIQLSEIYQVSIDYLIKGKEVEEEGKKEEEEGVIELVGKDDAIDETGGTVKEGRETGETVKEEDISGTEKKDKHTGKEDMDVIAKRGILLVCILISGFLCLCSIVFAARLLLNNAFEQKNAPDSIVHVSRIYEQYTKAEVENDDFKNEIIWLDVPGIREGDYVFCYMDGKSPSYDYYSKTLILPLISGIVFLIFFIVFIMEWQMHRVNKRSRK